MASSFPTLREFDKFFVGYDKLFDQFENVRNLTDNYPPYNIVKKSDTSYAIQIAVAGFSKEDIEITLDKNQLIVNSIVEDKDDKTEYLYKGLASRAFTRRFTISEYVQIRDAELVNGILNINLERLVPEEEKPTKIEIN